MRLRDRAALIVFLSLWVVVCATLLVVAVPIGDFFSYPISISRICHVDSYDLNGVLDEVIVSPVFSFDQIRRENVGVLDSSIGEQRISWFEGFEYVNFAIRKSLSVEDRLNARNHRAAEPNFRCVLISGRGIVLCPSPAPLKPWGDGSSLPIIAPLLGNLVTDKFSIFKFSSDVNPSRDHQRQVDCGLCKSYFASRFLEGVELLSGGSCLISQLSDSLVKSTNNLGGLSSRAVRAGFRNLYLAIGEIGNNHAKNKLDDSINPDFVRLLKDAGVMLSLGIGCWFLYVFTNLLAYLWNSWRRDWRDGLLWIACIGCLGLVIVCVHIAVNLTF